MIMRHTVMRVLKQKLKSSTRLNVLFEDGSRVQMFPSDPEYKKFEQCRIGMHVYLESDYIYTVKQYRFHRNPKLK